MSIQPVQIVSLKDIQDEIMATDRALNELKDIEANLYRIKYQLELVVNLFQGGNQRKFKVKNESLNPLPIYEKVEQSLLNILPVLKPSKIRIDNSTYQKYLRNQSVNASFKVFKDEIMSVSQDVNVYKDYKTFSTIFGRTEKGFFEINYDVLLDILQNFAKLDKGILIRFEKTVEFYQLPETFYLCFVRIDLITITLTFRKVPDQDAEVGIVNRKRVTIINVVYSHVFDTNSTAKLQKKSEPFYLVSDKARLNDPEIRDLVEVLQQNLYKISLPCLYPELAVFQRHSSFMGEWIESAWRATLKDRKTVEQDDQRKILSTIFKHIPDSFVRAMESTCTLCQSRFITDSQYQKLLPPLYMKNTQKTERPIHIECRKFYKGVDSDGPQIVVEIDCTDETNLFENYM